MQNYINCVLHRNDSIYGAHKIKGTSAYVHIAMTTAGTAKGEALFMRFKNK